MPLSKKSMCWIRCGLLLLITPLSSTLSLGQVTTVTASKDCSTNPCTVVGASFTLHFAQTVEWQATYNGTATQGHSFYLTTSPLANLADIPLTTTGQPSGMQTLGVGTYYISIKLALMGPGTYSVTFNAALHGDPHIRTIDGMRYDFQGAGEFVVLRYPGDQEIQGRHTPIATSFNPGPDQHDNLAMCVSLNSAVAARIGKHRVSYVPNISGVPDPSGLQLRVDGILIQLGPEGIDLGNGGRILPTSAPGGLELDFPNGNLFFVTPGWWADQNKWYLNFDLVPASAAAGLAGVVPRGSWLPALPDGTSLGPMPESLHDRYVVLYQKFADAWRVTDQSSLFDYGPGTSAKTFTMQNWPPEKPPCVLPNSIAVHPLPELMAKQACQGVIGENGNCVFDVMVTGNVGFATTYLQSQSLQRSPVAKPPKSTLCWILLLLVIILLILLLWLIFKRRR
jgi:hypothetical protein